VDRQGRIKLMLVGVSPAGGPTGAHQINAGWRQMEALPMQNAQSMLA